MKRLFTIVTTLLIIILSVSTVVFQGTATFYRSNSVYAQDTDPSVGSDITDYDKYEEEALAILEGMTLKQKIGQLFMVSPDAIKGSGSSVTNLTSEMKKKMSRYYVGGIIMFDRHIKSPSQISKFNKALTQNSIDYSGLPLFIAVDEEGGRVTRIAHNSKFKVTKYGSMLNIGRTGKTSKAKAVGRNIGKYLKKYGFTVDLAPVADCFTNPRNKVIGDRSFGSDPDKVKKMVASEIKGFHEQGIMTAIKHYPGHGNTSADTHHQTVKVTKSWNSLLKKELKPFIYNLDNTDMIMASHIRCTGIDKNIAPASLSYTMINQKLRKELGYDGVVITDSMGMAAVSNKYSSSEAAVKAIKAGCDIILCPINFPNAYNGVLKAVRSGNISEDRVNKSVLRIIKLKLKYADENT